MGEGIVLILLQLVVLAEARVAVVGRRLAIAAQLVVTLLRTYQQLATDSSLR